ncbi:hypothetical protein N184_04845 [Sinorhizobium sp. GL28]|nr:hypothetical protein N183_12705 [Sinorhizobium sp. Sb3]KSV93662.1 hypothetical protein N184_04845 [Sinorhizobium sp. GL28]
MLPIAELEAAADGAAIFDRRADVDIAGRVKGREMTREQLFEAGDEIDVIVAMKTARYFLQRNDVGVPDRGRDAFGVEAAVETDTVLDVVADEPHDIL